MLHPPLNRDREPYAWAHFNPGHFVEFNPSFVRLAENDAWAVFCRHSVPPEPGQGSIWVVGIDADLNPVGVPTLLIRHGSDPRVIKFGQRILLFYNIIEFDGSGAINGSSMAFAELAVQGVDWRCISNFRFPKQPIVGALSANANGDWEKHWIPFVDAESTVGMIYSHDPWNVITLQLEQGDQPRFGTLHQGPAVQWEYGTIRGGTPPVRYDDDTLITFFHASQVTGSRTVYTVGACVFLDKPPYSPKAFTSSPLLIAPYRSGVHRFGWRYAISVIFPGGVERVGNDYRLLCGRDDGEIVTFSISQEELRARMGPICSGAVGTVHDYRGGSGARLPLKALLYVPDPIPGIPELAMINFLKILAGRGRTFVDAGAHIGFYTMGLAPGYDRVVSFEPSRFQYRWLKRNAALNDYAHVECEYVALGDQAGEVTLNVLSYEGGLNSLVPEVASKYNILDRYIVPVETLDSRQMTDVDLLKIDVEGFEIPVLRGAVETINTSRPVILIEVWDDLERRQQLQAWMSEMDYSFDFIFPRSSELALCLPADRRHEFDWFV